MTNEPIVEVEASIEFLRNLKALSKRYRQIQTDLEPVLQQLAAGEILGQQIPGVNYPVFKVRVRNSDSRKGKRGGYRFIYYLRTPTKILLVTLYAKVDQSDIAAERVVEIIQAWEKANSSET